MRFFCDHDVPADVATTLSALGHDAWTAYQANLSVEDDDELTVYASNQRAVLITHDREFSQRRRQNVIGHHIWLDCAEIDAADILRAVLPEVTPMLEHNDHLWALTGRGGHRRAPRVSPCGPALPLSSDWAVASRS